MRKKILLISPNLKGIKGGINRIQPSLGMGYLAAVLEKSGYEVNIYDTALAGYDNQTLLDDKKTVLIGQSDEKIAKYISDFKPDIVGISIIFSNLMEHTHSIAKIVKKVNPRIKVIVGGNHITGSALNYRFEKMHDMEDDNIDYGMIGECDFQFTRLVKVLFNKKDPKSIKGFIYKENKKIFVNIEFPPRVDLKELPHPARHLMNMEDYFKIGLFHSTRAHSKRVLNVMVSRGCVGKCTFCTTPLIWGNRIRWREPFDVYKEIEKGVKRYNIGEIQFEDDNLATNPKYLIELCNLIKPLKIRWCVPNGIRIGPHLTAEVFAKMKEAGCYQITFGCESGVQRVLDKIIQKSLRLEQIIPTIQSAKKADLLVHTFWMAGLPDETKKEMEETIRIADQSNADSYSVAIFTPLPGSALYKYVIEKGLWWDQNRNLNNMTYRTSLIKVDGFDNAQKFEEWVNEKNIYLNRRDSKIKIKQT